MRFRRNTSLQEDMRNVVDNVEDMLATTRDDGTAAARDVRNRLMETLGIAKQGLADIDGQVRDTARHAVEVTDDYVHDSPWRAIGVGALVGLLAGVVISRGALASRAG